MHLKLPDAVREHLTAVEAAKKAKGGGGKKGKKKMSTKEWNEKNFAAGHFAA